MGDVFKEQLVKRQQTTQDTLKTVGLVIAAVVLIVVVFILSTSIPILRTINLFLFAAVIFGAYYLNSQSKKEFEYVYTNGELDVDSITNKAKRKRMFSQDVKDFELVVHATLMVDHNSEFASCVQVLDFSTGKVTDNTYYVLTNYKGKKTKMIIEPNDKILQAFSTVLTPRKLIKKR